MAQQNDQRLVDALGELERAVIAHARTTARVDKARMAVSELAAAAKGESRDEILRVTASLRAVRAGMRNLAVERPGMPLRIKYDDYLESPAWEATRRERLAAAKFKCERCGASETELNVHHLTYDRLGEELPSDLIVLCRRCHQREHGIEDSRSA